MVFQDLKAIADMIEQEVNYNALFVAGTTGATGATGVNGGV